MERMKHTVSLNRRVCYGAMGLALLVAGPASAFTGEKLAKDAKIGIAERAGHRAQGASGQDHG